MARAAELERLKAKLGPDARRRETEAVAADAASCADALHFLALPIDTSPGAVLAAAIPGDKGGAFYTVEARPTGYAVHYVRGFERPVMLNDAAGRILYTTLDGAIGRCERHHADRDPAPAADNLPDFRITIGAVYPADSFNAYHDGREANDRAHALALSEAPAAVVLWLRTGPDSFRRLWSSVPV